MVDTPKSKAVSDLRDEELARFQELIDSGRLKLPGQMGPEKCSSDYPHTDGRLQYRGNGEYHCQCGMNYIKVRGKLLAVPAGAGVNVISVAAATAVVGYNLLTNRVDLISSGMPRLLRALALTGSAAAGDTEVSTKVGDKELARLFNTATGFPTADASRFAVGPYYIAPGDSVSAPVIDAPVTNPINYLIDIG